MSTARRFDLLAFDWDGTLFDSTAAIVLAIQDACADVGAAVPSREQAAYVIGLGLVDALRHVAPGLPPERYPEMAQRYRVHYFARQHELSLFPGTLPMLQTLKARGHLLAVATGKSRHGLNEALAHTELLGVFDDSRTADETFSKPHPRMLQELMDVLQVPAERVLMIGDTTHDLQLAQNAGVASLAVSFGAHEPEAFAALSPLAVLHSTQELADWLTQHG